MNAHNVSLDDDARERISKLADNTAYYSALGYYIYVDAIALGETSGDDNRDRTVYFDLSRAEASTVYDGRVVILSDSHAVLRCEFDHRGHEHGADAWLSFDPEEEEPIAPDAAVRDVRFESGVVEG